MFRVVLMIILLAALLITLLVLAPASSYSCEWVEETGNVQACWEGVK